MTCSDDDSLPWNCIETVVLIHTVCFMHGPWTKGSIPELETRDCVQSSCTTYRSVVRVHVQKIQFILRGGDRKRGTEEVSLKFLGESDDPGRFVRPIGFFKKKLAVGGGEF
jgi:hypothetical protein